VTPEARALYEKAQEFAKAGDSIKGNREFEIGVGAVSEISPGFE
jgi:hypothetical protein